MVIPVGKSTEVRVGVAPPRAKLGVRRDVEGVITVTYGPGRIDYLQLINIGDLEVILRKRTLLGF